MHQRSRINPFLRLKMIAKINYSSPDISSVSRNPFILAPISIKDFLDLALIPYPYRNTSSAKLVKRASRVWLIRLSYSSRVWSWSLVVSCNQLILIYSHNKIIFALNPRFTAIGKYPKMQKKSIRVQNVLF